MKKILILLILCNVSYGQEVLTKFTNTLNTSKLKQKGIYSFINSNNNDFSLFLTDKNHIYTYNFNDKFSLKSKFKSENKRKKYKNIIGYNFLDNGDYKVYFKKKKNDFLEVLFSSKTNSSTTKEFKFLTDYENYLQSFTVNNKFYLLSSYKPVNGLYIYTFNEGVPKRNKIDLSKLNIFSNDGSIKELMNVLIEPIPLLKFNENTPNSLSVSARKRKMYVKNNSIIITLDNYSNYTQIINIDLKTFKASLKNIKKPLENIKRRKKKSNSYLINDKLFQLATSKDFFNLRITNINNQKIIKEYLISKNNQKDIKNSIATTPINLFEKHKINNTKKFLRNINQGKLTINVQYNNEKYFLTVGNFHGEQPNDDLELFLRKSSGGSEFNSTFHKISTTSYEPVSISNNIQYSFNNYINSSGFRKFLSVFDKKLTLLKNVKNINAFDKITEYLKSNNKTYNLEKLFFSDIILNKVVFKYKDFYIYIDYNKKEKSFELLKFTN